MNHRIVSRVVTLIAVLFAVVAVMFALVIDARDPAVTEAPAAQAVPHPVAGEGSACGECHTLDDDSLPLTHRYYSWTTCDGCHALARPPRVPHTASMELARCMVCHSDTASDAGVSPSHLSYPKYRCLFCHPPNPDESDRVPDPVGEFARPKPPINHGVEGAFENCLYCHKIAGTPPMPASHWSYELRTCQWCHETAAAETTAAPTSD